MRRAPRVLLVGVDVRRFVLAAGLLVSVAVGCGAGSALAQSPVPSVRVWTTSNPSVASFTCSQPATVSRTPGYVVLERTGDLSQHLTVRFQVSGPVRSTPPIAVFRAGSALTSIALVPLPDAGSATLQFSLEDAADYDLGDPSSAEVGIAFATNGCASKPRQLSVTPSSGPIGTRVAVSGTACFSLDTRVVQLVFQSDETGGTTGTPGRTELAPFDAAPAPDFTFSGFVTIPATVESTQSDGPQAVVPGTYSIVSKSPGCLGTFTVTASAARVTALPATGSQVDNVDAASTAVVLLMVGSTILLATRHRASTR